MSYKDFAKENLAALSDFGVEQLIKTEGTPLCPRCSGRSIFTGNEKPDGRWIKRWKHHFLCIACRSSFHRVADDPCEIKVGEGDDDAKEPQE